MHRWKDVDILMPKDERFGDKGSRALVKFLCLKAFLLLLKTLLHYIGLPIQRRQLDATVMMESKDGASCRSAHFIRGLLVAFGGSFLRRPDWDSTRE